MAIFRGTGGAGDSTDDSIVSEVTEQAGIATTKAQEAATSATNASNSASSASSSETAASTSATAAAGSASTATTKASEAASHASDALASKNAAATSATAAADSATAANSANVQTVAGLSTEITNLNGIRTDITGVNAVRADVVTVSGISSNVTTVAADASDIGTVATNITNVNNVGDNISNVNAVHSNASNINTVAADGSDIGTVAGNISNVNTVAGISSDVTTVAGLESKMDAVIADASDIGAVAGNIGNVNTVAGDSSDINTVAGISADVTSVADNMTDVQNADTNAANAATSASNASDSASAASTSASSASSSASSASTSATNAGNSATAASNSATAASGSASAASGSASAASGSASAAASSASAASTSKSNAATSETNAASSASAAATSATNAATSETNAAASATDSSNAASTWSNYYNTYVGASSSAPTVDVQGNALVAGALYFNTTNNTTYVWTGSAWNAVANNNIINPNVALTQDLATNGNDINFGDNDKATFGASDDLQIYHDGSNSYIKDSGTGSLLIDATNLYLRNSSGEEYASFISDGAANLKYNGSTRIVTTSTGIDVTGTATMDGLTVDGAADIDYQSGATNNTAPDTLKVSNKTTGVHAAGLGASIKFEHTNSSASYSGSRISNVSNADPFTSNLSFYPYNYGYKEAMRISSNGDISFYEDTGTTPKLFWDASAERLGLGTTSPQRPFHLHIGTDNTAARFQSTDTEVALEFIDPAGTAYFRASGDYIKMGATQSDSLTILDGGNVGIGTSSPNHNLSVNSSSTGIISVGDFTGDNVKTYIEADQTNNVARLNSRNNHPLVFAVNNTERMRIDSSGNLLVGTTSSTLYSSTSETGTNITSQGGLYVAHNGTNVPNFNRITTDGDIVKFRKDGTTVGSIGTRANYIKIGNGDTNLLFNSASDAVTPEGASDNRDAAVDLGRSVSRFKDLYLSGGVYLGGPSEINSSIAYLRSSSTNTSSLTLRKSASGADSVDYVQCRNTANTLKLVIENDGDIKNTNNSYGAISDEKLKENIVDATSQWNDIKAVRVRKYSLKEYGLDAPNMLGVVAQELESAGMNGLVSESVDRNEDNEDLGTVTKSVNYSILYMKAVKALQEAMDRIETLETRIAALEE